MQMNRRQFLAIASGLAAGRVLAQPQGPVDRLSRVGIYLTGPLNAQRSYVSLFFGELRELGWTEGTNLALEHARYPSRDLYPPDDEAQMVAIARELVERRVDVIWLLSSISATIMAKVNKKIPVVGAAVSDVVDRGLAMSLAKPGKNFTGISNFTWELGDKRFQLLHELMPKLSRVGVLMHPTNDNCIRELKKIEGAAAPLGVTVIPAMMQREDQAEEAFAHLAKARVQALLIAHFPLFQSSRKVLLKLAADHRIPAVGHRTYFVQDGALLAYSTVLEDQMRRSAHLVDKILRGANPGDIPVEQPMKFELVINGKAAKTYGLTIPQSLQIQAAKII